MGRTKTGCRDPYFRIIEVMGAHVNLEVIWHLDQAAGERESAVLFSWVVFEVAFERRDKSVYWPMFIEHVPCAPRFAAPVPRMAMRNGRKV